jgi:disulfide bond formation protein DsbB
MNKSVCECVSKSLSMPYAALLVMAASLGAIGFAFIMQYGFNIQPCELCLIQRVPFGIAAALAATACIGRPYGTRARVLLGFCAAAFLINTGVAIFHTGVEQHWWEGTKGCHFAPLHGTSPESWREQIMNMAVGHCDEISWTFLGLSMTNWNIPFSFALAVFAFVAALCQGRKVKS